MKFAIGYNYDINLLNLLEIYKKDIEAFYFPIPQIYLGSGRAIKEPKSYTNEIPLIIKKCCALNIKPQLLLNATYEDISSFSKRFFNSMLTYIKKLRDAGLSSIVVVNPIYISLIRKEISDITIESSVNCYMKTLEHALHLKELGVDVLTIDRDINRNIPLIKEIKNKTGLKLRVMLNEGCVGGCPYRNHHSNHLLTGFNLPRKPVEGVLWGMFCIEIYRRDPLKLFRIPFIPPEAVSRYEEFVDYCKLSTRVFPTYRIETCLKAYIDRHFSGNLLTILDSPGISYFEYADYGILKKNNFFKKMLTCNLECRTCRYCRVLFKKAVMIKRDYQGKRGKEDERKCIEFYKKNLKLPLKNKREKIKSYIKIAESYLKLGRYEEGIRNARRALKLNYMVSDAYCILGFCYEAVKNFKEAIEVLKIAEKISPKKRSIKLALARCYKELGESTLQNKEIDKIIKSAVLSRPKL